MLDFRKVTADDKCWITECIEKGSTDGACYCFGNLFCWGEQYGLEIAELEGMCLLRSVYEGRISYAYPSGSGDIKNAVIAMMEDAKTAGQPFRMHQLLENNKKELENLFPDVFSFRYDRDASEYVYLVKNMQELAGKKLHGKKGHVNAFFRKHEDVRCDPITADNIHLCLEIAQSWLSEKDSEDDSLVHEYAAIEKAVNNFSLLGFMGAVLYADGKPVAFTMGERIKNNTFCTHYEKTVPEYRDAFPVINNGFSKLMLDGFEYVNREEDTGSEGLRKAKLSYYPEFLLDKYTLRLKNDPARKYYADESDFDELADLWSDVFGDERVYPEQFLKYCINAGDICAHRENGSIVSAFYLIDAELVHCNQKFSGKYLYAAATHPDYRNKGIMSNMIKSVAEELKKQGYSFICLYPADESLYGYYEKLGFSAVFSETLHTLNKSELAAFSGSRYFNSTADYKSARDYIPAESYIKFDNKYTDFARFTAKHAASGFEAAVCFDDEDKVFIIGNIENGDIAVTEAISQDGNYSHILNVLADMKPEGVTLKTPVGVKLPVGTSVNIKSGMLLRLDEMPEISGIYLGQPCM